MIFATIISTTRTPRGRCGRGVDAYQIDAWVRQVITAKLEQLAGHRWADLEAVIASIPRTPGLEGLIEYCALHDLPIMFIGAVPVELTRRLIGLSGVTGKEFPTLIGSETEIDADGVIGRVTGICTPSRKVIELRAWCTAQGVSLSDCYFIGDSLGDLPAMRCLPQANRIAFNAEQPAVLAAAGAHWCDDLTPVVAYLRDRLALPTVSPV